MSDENPDTPPHWIREDMPLEAPPEPLISGDGRFQDVKSVEYGEYGQIVRVEYYPPSA
jgi:hypothetical protein